MLDLPVTLAGLFVGLTVGLTGMGGGALMTPLLVLVFGVQPLAAVSSDLVASMVMKPIGGGVHLKRGTVHRGLVTWLVLGSVPSAFAGVLVVRAIGGSALQVVIRDALGVALLVVALALVVRQLVRRGERADAEPLVVRPVPTLLVGMAGGLVVGMTSVGSGSLMMLMLLVLYPRLRLSELVGTDLVQAVPLVAAAALAHLLFGDFHAGLTLSILLGAVPGVYLGARLSSRAPDQLIRPALVVVLLASGMKLLGVDNTVLAFAVGALVLGAVAVGIARARRAPSARLEPARGAGPDQPPSASVASDAPSARSELSAR